MVFRKKGIETYDYTLLQKRGLLKKEEAKRSGVKVTKDGYFELGGNAENLKEEIQSAGANLAGNFPADEKNPLSFLDTFAASVSSNSDGQNFNSGSAADDKSVQHLNVKLEDLEYKLERFLERLEKIEERILKFEQK